MAAKALLEPIKCGALTLQNRVLMAPLTRCQAKMPGHIPSDIMAEYYGQRASGGMLICEATLIAPNTSAFWTEPGCWNAEQVEGWKKSVDAVHKKGGKMCLQLFHPGRSSHPDLNPPNEAVVVAPSPIAITHRLGAEFHPKGEPVANVVPRELRDDEIPAIIEQFVNAAKCAKEAGFDAIEIHGANAYLINQFIGTKSNVRKTGPYSCESVENRTRLLFEVIDAIVKAGHFGAGCIGLRISPLNQFGDNRSEDPEAVTEHVCKQAEARGLAFVDLMRADFFGPVKADIVSVARPCLKNTALFVNMGYTPKEGEETVASKKADGIIYGTLFLANPDLPERIKAATDLEKVDLNTPNSKTFYPRKAEGYTDYPFMKN